MFTRKRMVFNRLEIGPGGIARQKEPLMQGRFAVESLWNPWADDDDDFNGVSVARWRRMQEYIDDALRYDGIRVSQEVLHGRTDNT